MGLILSFFGAGALAPAMVARLQVLLIGAAVLAVAFLGVVTWALFEQSGKHAAQRDAEHFKAQSQVLADSLGRCNAGVERAAAAGQAATAETKRLLAMAERALERNAAVREEIRGIVSKPAPLRADGKPKDCGDAFGEIKQKVKP